MLFVLYVHLVLSTGQQELQEVVVPDVVKLKVKDQELELPFELDSQGRLHVPRVKEVLATYKLQLRFLGGVGVMCDDKGYTLRKWKKDDVIPVDVVGNSGKPCWTVVGQSGGWLGCNHYVASFWSCSATCFSLIANCSRACLVETEHRSQLQGSVFWHPLVRGSDLIVGSQPVVANCCRIISHVLQVGRLSKPMPQRSHGGSASIHV